MTLPWRSHLKCPKCGREFDYDYVPGASVTAVRLWNRRYMSCPLCHRWSVFKLTETRVSTAPTSSTGTPPDGS